MKVKVIKDKCIGCGNCVALSESQIFDFNDDGLAETIIDNIPTELEETAKDARLLDADLIICSPYTRALQTAAIISREIDKEIVVEPELHEWIVDKTNSITSSEEVAMLGKEFHNNNHKNYG